MASQHCPSRRSRRNHQDGQVLIAMLLILGVGVAALVYALATPSTVDLENDKKTAAALAQARDALIGYAASHATRPGSLPCPATDVDGLIESSSCSSLPSRIGRLPWKKLGLPDPRDGYGERLWYAVSANFTNSPVVGVLNTNTAGEYTVDGVNVIAIVFAPGAAVGSQVRDAAGKNNVANYLDGENANGDTVFVTRLPPPTTFNDKLLAITHDMLFRPVEMRAAREALGALTDYFATRNYFPFANDYSGSPSGCVPSSSGRIPLTPTLCGQDDWTFSFSPWFFANNWHEVLFYAVAPSCTSFGVSTCDGAGGFLSVDGTSGIRAILMMPSRALTGQTRPCAEVKDCLEDPENINGDLNYIKPTTSAAVNDRLLMVSP